MDLTQGNKIAIIVGIGAVLLSGLVTVWVNDWYAPDLRYETGGYYVTKGTAITSLKLENFGRRDVESAVAVVNFDHPIVDVSTDSMSVNLSITSGEIGDKAIAISVDRIVEQEIVHIYFAVANDGPLSKGRQADFLTSLTFKGGMGEEGQPVPTYKFVVAGLVILVYGIIVALLMRQWAVTRDLLFRAVSSTFTEAYAAHLQGKDEEEFVSDYYLKRLTARILGGDFPKDLAHFAYALIGGLLKRHAPAEDNDEANQFAVDGASRTAEPPRAP